jgi:Na+/proline symporter
MNIPVTLLFLSVGASLFVHYQTFPDPQVADYLAQGHADYVFPHFMLTVLEPGVRGLLMAGLLAAAMSSLDSALNALSSTAYVDLWRKYVSPDDGPDQALWKSRMLSLVFALVLMAVAVVFGQMDGVLWVGFKVMGYTYGSMLGLFLVAVWTERRGSDLGNLVAVVVSIACVVKGTAPVEAGGMGIAWPWSIVIGTGVTFLVGAAFPTPPNEVVEEAPPGDLPAKKG